MHKLAGKMHGAPFLLFALAVLSGPAFATETVNVNTADAATLARALNGVGPATARAIVAYREANGPFESVEELIQVRGIGVKLLERNRARVVLAPSPPGRTAPPAKQASGDEPSAYRN